VDLGFHTANAQTSHFWIALTAWFPVIATDGDHFEASKGLADDREWGRHGIGRFSVVLSSGRPARTGVHCEKLGAKPEKGQA